MPDEKGFTKKDTRSKRKVLRPVRKDTSKMKTAPPVVSLGPYDLYFSDWSPNGRYISGALPGGLDASGEILIIDIKRNAWLRVQDGLFSRFCGENRILWARPLGSSWTAENDIVYYDIKKEKLTQLAFDSMFILDKPVPSPDGKRVAYTFSSVDHRGELWIVDIDGSNPIRLLGEEDFDDQYLSNISFSPDANSILFIPVKKRGYDLELRGAIHILDADGNNLRAITDVIAKWRGGVSWSPDGTQIVFTSDRDGNDELYIVNADGSGLRRLTSNTAMDCCPDW
ncbi:MAG: hypothetical protein GTO24_16750 [candidate division Zixibacteria bacterium]|nr:hypothetical protein [candidate division Zixibacteria bacterium]